MRFIFTDIKDNILKKIDLELSKSSSLYKKDIKSIYSAEIDEYVHAFGDKKRLPHMSKKFEKSLENKLNEFSNEIMISVFQKSPLSVTQKKKLISIIIDAVVRDQFPDSISGIVIAGFGEDELFPSLRNYFIEAFVNGKLKYKGDEKKGNDIGIETGAIVRSFAQSDVVYTFLEGIDQKYRKNKREYLERIFSDYPSVLVENLRELKNLNVKRKRIIKSALEKSGKNLYKEYVKSMEKYSRQNFTDPILNIVRVLPIDELAAVAESLVNITSFKRKVSMAQETVGGPIDVAVISKGDGFIWIKRKHYFKSELNPHFFRKYYGGCSNEKS